MSKTIDAPDMDATAQEGRRNPAGIRRNDRAGGREDRMQDRLHSAILRTSDPKERSRSVHGATPKWLGSLCISVHETSKKTEQLLTCSGRDVEITAPSLERG